MKKSYLFFGLGILLLGAALAMGAFLRERPAKEALVPGEALVQFKETITNGQAKALIQKGGAHLKEIIEPQRIYVVTFSKSFPVAQMVERFRQMPEVAHAEMNGLYEALFLDLLLPSESYAEEQSSQIGAGSKVRVAVIDTAIDANHPVLAGKVVQGYNILNNTTNTQSSGIGQDWHGTASAGRVLDGTGGANVEIMPVQVFGSWGGASWSTIIKAINYATDNGAQIINMSLGGASYSPLVQQAIDRAVEKGIVVVASAGNTGADQVFYPAAYKGVISVAATNEDGKKAGFSTYHETVDMSAPGDRMKLLSHGGYRYAMGTSFSAPFIAGALGLLKSAFPFLTAAQCEEIVKSKSNNVYDHNADRFLGKLGAGFINFQTIKDWVTQIKAGTFKFPWQVGAPVPPVVAPPAGTPPQPWLVRGRGHSGAYILTPSGDVVQEKK